MSLLEKALGRFRGDTVPVLNDDHDDVTVLEDRIVTIKNKDGENDMEHMLFKISAKDEYGQYQTFWKAVSMLTITRTPFQLREAKKLKQITDEVLRGLCRTEVNYLLMIANVLTPRPLGLLYCYGVQAIGDTAEEAMQQASHDYTALCKGLTGAFRGMEYRRLSEEEGRAISKKLSEMQELLMIRGIPDARDEGANKTITGMGQGDVNPGAEEQVEEFIRAMSDREFIFMVITSPVEAMDINRWLGVVSEELSRWKSQMQGSKVASAGLSIPISLANNAGVSHGTTHALGVGQAHAHTVGHADGTNTSWSQTHTVGASHGGGTAHTNSVGQNWGTGHTDSTSHSQALSHTTSLTHTQSHTHTDGTSLTHTASHSVGGGTSHSVTDSTGASHTVSNGHSVGGGTSDTSGTNWSTSHGVSNSASHGVTNSASHGGSTTHTTSAGTSHSTGGSTTNTTTTGHSTGTTNTTSHSTTNTTGHGGSNGTSYTTSNATSVGGNAGVDLGVRLGVNTNNMSGTSLAHNAATTHMDSTGHTTGSSLGHSFTNSNSQSHAVGSNYSNSSSLTHSTANGSNWSSGNAVSNTQSHGTTDTSMSGGSRTHGVSSNWSNTSSVANGSTTGHSVGNTTSSNWSNGTSVARGQSSSDSYGTSTAEGVSNGVTNTSGTGTADSTTQGNSVGASNSTSSNWSNSVSDSTGTSQGVSHTNSTADQQQSSATTNYGSSNSATAAMSGGMAVGPFFSVSKSYQWFDARVENLVNILDAQRERLLKSQEGQGMMYVDVFIFVADEGSKRAAQTAASAAFFGNKFPTPIEVIEPEDEDVSHLQMHGRAFSPCNARENSTDIIDQYKWSTLLLPSELSAYAAPLRIEIGGASTNVEDIPIMRVPTNRMNRDALIGNIVSGDRWHPDSGYVTPYEFRIGSQELHHLGIFGSSRTGKTVGATRMLTEIYHNMKFPAKNGQMVAPSIVVLDWKRDWRILQRYTDSDKFSHYTLADYGVNPIKMNLLQVPPGVGTQEWMDSFIEMFCLSFSMGGRAKSIIWQHLVALYNGVDAFRHPENSWKVTADDLYQAVFKSKEGFENQKRKGGKVGNETRDAYSRLLDRLIYFHWGILRDMFCYSAQDATTIPDLCKEDGHVTVIEGEGLDPESKKFVISIIGNGIYTYGLRKGGFDGGLILVLEEAHQVLMGAGGDSASDSTVMNIGESKWEIMFAEAAGWNMFLFVISQSPSKMPQACLTNTGITMTFRIDVEDDVNAIMNKLAKNARYDHRDIARWLQRSPVGWSVVRSSRVRDFKDSEPSIVSIKPLDGSKPTDDELRKWSRTPTLPDFDAVELDS